MGTDAAQVRRRELAGFLRTRRERIRPDQVGLPPGGRRRTPGLRREEVAQLAGVGVTWYTWLEQGRDIRASPQVLDAVARTLLLDVHERAHLFTLAGSPVGSPPQSCGLPDNIGMVLDQLNPLPAAIHNARYDVLAYNATYGVLVADLSAIPNEERNLLWLAFTHPDWRTGLVDWDDSVRRMVAQFRAAMAEHVAEPTWKALVHRLRAASPEFVELWERHDVQGGPSPWLKLFRQPQVGLLQLHSATLYLTPGVGTRMITYTPVDDEAMQRLVRVHALAAA